MRWRAASTSARSGTGEALIPRVYHGSPSPRMRQDQGHGTRRTARKKSGPMLSYTRAAGFPPRLNIPAACRTCWAVHPAIHAGLAAISHPRLRQASPATGLTTPPRRQCSAPHAGGLQVLAWCQHGAVRVALHRPGLLCRTMWVRCPAGGPVPRWRRTPRSRPRYPSVHLVTALLWRALTLTHPEAGVELRRSGPPLAPGRTIPGLGVSDELVGEEGEAVTDGLDIDEAHGFLVAGLAEEALAVPERDRVDEQP
jgi:hypothetical protein